MDGNSSKRNIQINAVLTIRQRSHHIRWPVKLGFKLGNVLFTNRKAKNGNRT
jgi:hypothetical protein